MGLWRSEVEPVKRQGWTFRVSRAFLRRKDISAAEKITALAILAYADKQGVCCPTMLQLAADLSIHHETVKVHVAALRAAAVLSWTLWTDEHGHKRRNYSLKSSIGLPSERLFIPPSDWDGLGGKGADGRRTMQNPPG